MARMSRLAVAGHPHHLFQRGNDRTALFRDDADRERYLGFLREAAAAAKVALHAYVLMDDHVHLLATPAGAEGLSRMMQALGRNYVGWFNHRHQRSGTLWEGRFRSSLIEADSWLLPCMRYIELNPVRAALAAQPAEFLWSSHRHHVGLTLEPLITDHPVYWSLGNTPFERQAAYLQMFEHGPGEAELALIRRSTRGGWLLGSTDAVPRSGASRRAVALKAGRPRKK